jgi:hypothetical protein
MILIGVAYHPSVQQVRTKQPLYLWSRHLQMTVCHRFL